MTWDIEMSSRKDCGRFHKAPEKRDYQTDMTESQCRLGLLANRNCPKQTQRGTLPAAGHLREPGKRRGCHVGHPEKDSHPEQADSMATKVLPISDLKAL